MGKVTGLAHIGIFVSDLEASKAFYMGKLGFAEDGCDDLGDTVLSFLSNGNCLLELVWKKGKERVPNYSAVIDHVCMEVEDIDSLVADLKAQGIAFDGEVNLAPQIHGGVKNIFFRGPDGERIEFFEYLR